MASLMASCGFALLTYVLIAVGAFLALLRVAFVILLHPFQALKKTPRDGKGGGRDYMDCSPYLPAVGISQPRARSSHCPVFDCL